jgi:hypothetical protein
MFTVLVLVSIRGASVLLPEFYLGEPFKSTPTTVYFSYDAFETPHLLISDVVDRSETERLVGFMTPLCEQ